MTNHLDRQTIYGLLDDELDPVAERSAEAHLLRCDRCRAAREQCRETLERLRAFGEAYAPPSPTYWEAFWARFEDRVDRTPIERREEAEVVSFRRAWTRPAMAAAAALGLMLGGWWAIGRDAGIAEPPGLRTVVARPLVADAGWETDLEFYERATVAVGSVDPLSKGLVLASMAEAP